MADHVPSEVRPGVAVVQAEAPVAGPPPPTPASQETLGAFSARRIAGTALVASSLFLALVAVLINSPGLFYMATALIATIATARLQAWLSVRGLRFERFAPDVARVGERVKVEVVVWSERKIRRPLVNILDHLPPRLAVADRTPSLPIAPDFDQPVRTEYSFRPLRRGRFRWSSLEAIGTDALGLTTMSKPYRTEMVEMTVLPSPIPVAVELPSATGWGVSEATSGQNKGAGVEPRGVREYTYGDSIRHIHWRSSARANRLMVKEFEAGSHAQVMFLLQRTHGTDLGKPPLTSLDLMCGHALHLSEVFLRQGAKVSFPQVEGTLRGNASERLVEIATELAEFQATEAESLGLEVQKVSTMDGGSVVFLMVVEADRSLIDAIAWLRGKGATPVVLAYDAAPFAESRRSLVSASDPAYMESVRRAGAFTVSMPVLT